jgi:hypothetical protein
MINIGEDNEGGGDLVISLSNEYESLSALFTAFYPSSVRSEFQAIISAVDFDRPLHSLVDILHNDPDSGCCCCSVM